jgi:hypothetical protein
VSSFRHDRLDVAVDQAALESVLQAKGRLTNVLACLGGRQWPALANQASQVNALDVFHDQEMRVADLVGVVGQHDIGMR